MKNFLIFLIISLITAGGFLFWENKNSTEQPNYNLSLYEVRNLDFEELPVLLDNDATIVFTPTSFTSSELELLSVPRVIDYQLTVPLSLFYNQEKQKLNYQLISDFELVLNVISREFQLNEVYVDSESVLINILEPVSLFSNRTLFLREFIDLNGKSKDAFSLQYFKQLVSILDNSTVQSLNPNQVKVLSYYSEEFISNISNDIIKAFNPAINVKNKSKAQQVVYLLQHTQSNPDLLENEYSPLSQDFFKTIDKQKIINQYKKIHNI